MWTCSVCRVPSKPMTVSQKSRMTLHSGSSSDETSDSDEDTDDSNTSDDDNDVGVSVELAAPALDKNIQPADDSAQQVIHCTAFLTVLPVCLCA